MVKSRPTSRCESTRRRNAITLDGRPLPSSEPLRYYALNKPLGVLSSARDDRGRTTVVDLLPAKRPALRFPSDASIWTAKA